MYFDTHAHYTSNSFRQDRAAVMAALPDAGISLVVCPGDTIEASRHAVELAAEYPYVYAAVGVHPGEAGDVTPGYLVHLEELAKRPKVVAIGEIGLDYYHADNPPRDVQNQVFNDQLSLAEKLNLPVIVHDREAHGDTLAQVQAHPNVKGVYHCYSGALEDAKVLVAMGWMLSFTGAITFNNARKALEVIQGIPLSHIMLETDAPYLTPVPNRGKRNDSRYLPFVAQRVAQVKGITTQEVAQVTLENGKRFFGIA